MADVSQSGSYRKITPKTKVPLSKKLADAWSKTWYFERLLLLLIVLVVPFLLHGAWQSFVSGFTLRSEAAKVASQLRRIKERAHELNCEGTLAGTPSQPGAVGSYQISYDKEGESANQELLPKGIILVGSVTFDPQGVPNRASVLRLRQGLDHASVVISAQGGIVVP